MKESRRTNWSWNQTELPVTVPLSADGSAKRPTDPWRNSCSFFFVFFWSTQMSEKVWRSKRSKGNILSPCAGKSLKVATSGDRNLSPRAHSHWPQESCIISPETTAGLSSGNLHHRLCVGGAWRSRPPHTFQRSTCEVCFQMCAEWIQSFLLHMRGAHSSALYFELQKWRSGGRRRDTNIAPVFAFRLSLYLLKSRSYWVRRVWRTMGISLTHLPPLLLTFSLSHITFS